MAENAMQPAQNRRQASPGNDTTIDTDQIASSVVSAIVPFPV